MARKAKVITNYRDYNIKKMKGIWIRSGGTWSSENSGLHLNPNFVFSGTSEADYMAAGTDWEEAQEKAETIGGSLTKSNAKELLTTFKKCMKTITMQMNVQQTGNGTKLKSGGFPLAKTGGAVGAMSRPMIKDISSIKGLKGAARIKMTKSLKHCIGTWVRMTDVQDDTYTEFFVQEKHILKIYELTQGKEYGFEVAYAGKDKRKVWSYIRMFFAQ